jgi:hypothetical protein
MVFRKNTSIVSVCQLTFSLLVSEKKLEDYRKNCQNYLMYYIFKTERLTFELRCHMYQGRNLIGLGNA